MAPTDAGARAQKIKFLNGRIKRMRVIHRTYKVDMRDLSKDERKPYETMYKQHEETITRLVQDLDWAKSDGDRKELMDGEAARDAMLDKADKLQKEDLDAVKRMQERVADAQSIGAGTAENMHRQMDQLANTVEVLDEQHLLLRQGSLQLRAFARRIATDKIILGCLCIVFTLVVVIIIVSSLAPDALGDAVAVPDALVIPTGPPMPAPTTSR